MAFQFYLPTKIIFGQNCIQENSGQLRRLGTCAFIMSGKRSAAKNGALEDMTQALAAKGVRWYHYNRVPPNPCIEDVKAAADRAKEQGADFIVALGGGSPMDAAKAVAVLAAGDLPGDALFSQNEFDTVLPLAVVPTTAGTGSEVTPYAILTNKKLETKSFLTSDQVFPDLAFLDARYTMALPQTVTTATVVDALTHSIEGYLAVRAIPPGRMFALESLNEIGALLPVLSAGTPLDLEQRERLLYASMLAGIVISQSGTTAVHAMGYSLTYFKGVDHGVANGLLITEYLRYIAKTRSGEVTILLEALGLDSLDAMAAVLLDLLGKFCLTDKEVDRFVAIAAKAGNIQNTRPQPTQEDLRQILGNCFLK